MAIPLDQATLDSLSITDSYSEPMGMAYLFELIDLNQNERDHLVCDGFYSIQDFVALYKYDYKKLDISFEYSNRKSILSAFLILLL